MSLLALFKFLRFRRDVELIALKITKFSGMKVSNKTRWTHPLDNLCMMAFVFSVYRLCYFGQIYSDVILMCGIHNCREGR